MCMLFEGHIFSKFNPFQYCNVCVIFHHYIKKINEKYNYLTISLFFVFYAISIEKLFFHRFFETYLQNTLTNKKKFAYPFLKRDTFFIILNLFQPPVLHFKLLDLVHFFGKMLLARIIKNHKIDNYFWSG